MFYLEVENFRSHDHIYTYPTFSNLNSQWSIELVARSAHSKITASRNAHECAVGNMTSSLFIHEKLSKQNNSQE